MRSHPPGRSSERAPNRQLGGKRHITRPTAEKGEGHQAIGRSRGGRTMTNRAQADTQCRPVAFVLTSGQFPDCVVTAAYAEFLHPWSAWRNAVQFHGVRSLSRLFR